MKLTRLRQTITALTSFAWLSSLPAQPSELTTQIDALFADFDSSGVPGCAVGVIQDGEYIHARGYGMANLEHGIPIGPDTVFRVGSVSKQFTGAAIAILAGRANWT